MGTRTFLAMAIAVILLSVPPAYGGKTPGLVGRGTALGPVQASDHSLAQKGDFDEFERKVKELLQELERLQKEAAQKFRKDVLPQIQKEIDKLKEWLRDFHLDNGDEPERRET